MPNPPESAAAAADERPDLRDADAEDRDDPTTKMSFFDHLVELRTRIFWALAFVAIGFAIGFYCSEAAYHFLAQPMMDALRGAGLEDKLVSTSPLGPLRLYISVGLYLGVVIASPMVLYQIWLFVAPGLYRNERRAALGFMFSSVFLFLAGTAFGYVVMLPVTLKFLVTFFVNSQFIPLISINEYFDMVLVILLGLGVVFQLPVLIFFLSIFGIVTPKFLWDNFRYAVLLIAVIAALVTPTTDIVTMTIFMAPMIALYLLGIGVSFVVAQRRAKAAGEAVVGTATYVAWAIVILGVTALLWAGWHYGWWQKLKW